MKSAFRNAYILSLYRSLNPNILASISLTTLPSSARPLSALQNAPFRSLCSTICFSSLTMAATGDRNSSSPPTLENQFKEFRTHLEESGSVREKIRSVVSEIESSSRCIHVSLLLVHQSRPVSEILEEAKAQIEVLKKLYSQLADIIKDRPGQFYRYHGDWKSETQTVVSLLAFMHWLETGNLLLHSEAEEKLGLNSSEFGLDIEDYLIGICFMSNEMPRYVVNRVTAGDYDCPRKVLKFLTDLHAAFRMLNLRNDFLRKKFDGMKYDLRRVEEVYYDVKIRGLASNGDLVADQIVEGQS
ncbi:translin [Ricinus communis]|uniref:Translin, putative n=1 Tax=Ricinus communis TaxID=3988 RepID=B9S0J5_RICCO|nr:translin [Ricinus communis]EEF42928.1 translin, putative [Ricinus communis]|eukprot:XP_002519514.1 translin [Ricinus communis]